MRDTQPSSKLQVRDSQPPTSRLRSPIVLPAARRYGGFGAIGDRWIVAAAAAAALGAWFAWPWHWWLGAAALVVAVVARLPALVVVGMLILAAAVASSQLATLTEPTSGPIDAQVVIVADPEWRRGALTTQFRVAATGRRWEGWARGSVAYRLEDALVGESWHLTGAGEVADADEGRYLWPRHLVGRVQIDDARMIDSGSAPFRFANSVRTLIASSDKSLSRRDRALLAGFIYGDDRDQLPEVLHDFRASSLTHLLAVSGSNVAFVLLLVAPLLLRLRLWWRLVAVAALLAEFAVLTRAEPSVLRACVLATLAVGAQAIGRRASMMRLLALAVAVLVVADPLLVHAAGFQLSVAAAAGIVLGAGPIERHLRGPRWLRLALAVTLAAQMGVLPVQLWLFGSLPLASVPANVLAGPMAGPAMIWGLVAGILGGLGGDEVAALLHVPTRFMVGWVAAVARWTAALGWPAIEPGELLPLSGVIAVTCVAARQSARAVRMSTLRLAIIPLGVVGVWLVADLHRPELATTAQFEVIDNAAQPGRSKVVIVDRPGPAWVLDQLGTSGVRRIDLLIARSSSRAGREAVRAIQSRHDVAQLWVPGGFGTPPGYHAPVNINVIDQPTRLAPRFSGAATITVLPRANRLDLDFTASRFDLGFSASRFDLGSSASRFDLGSTG